MTAARWRIVLWAAMLLLVAWVAWQARWALLPFSIGALLAYVLTPVVDHLAALVPGRARQESVVLRGIAVVLVYLAIAGVLAGVGVAVVPVAAHEISEFVKDLPTHIDDTQVQVNEWLEVYRERVPTDIRERIDGYAADFGDDLGGRIASAGAPVFESLTGWIAVIAGFVVVPIWMFYALRDRHNFERNFAAAVPEPVQPDVLNGIRIADQLIGFLGDNLPELSRIVDIEALITNRIDSFEVRDVEKLVMSISGRHLRWINWFGAGLGAIIGLIQLGLNPPL